MKKYITLGLFFVLFGFGCKQTQPLSSLDENILYNYYNLGKTAYALSVYDFYEKNLRCPVTDEEYQYVWLSADTICMEYLLNDDEQ